MENEEPLNKDDELVQISRRPRRHPKVGVKVNKMTFKTSQSKKSNKSDVQKYHRILSSLVNANDGPSD